MELNGYQEGVDFFVWPYNWTQSIDLSSEDLKEFIDGLNLQSGEKVDLVGHSLGGMVSRDFAQDYPELVDKVITVGSPHQGAVQAYQALAGGKIGEQRDLEWIGMQLLVHINRRGFQTNAEVVRGLAEVLNDLTPTFQYLNKNNSYLQTHAYQNSYLSGINNSTDTDSFINRAVFFAGNMIDSTPLELKLGGTNIVDQLLGLWPDGKPLKTIFGIGDETVLRSSSYLGSELTYEYPLEHKELINDDLSLTEIFKSLGINSPQLAVSNQPPTVDDMLIFYLASPAELEIKNIGTGQTYVPQNPDIQMVYLNYPENVKEYTAKLNGTGDGQYHLYVGQLTEEGSFWRSYGGEISFGEEKYYNFEIDLNRLKMDPLIDQTGKKFLEQALIKLEELNSQNNQHLNSGEANLQTAITNVENGKWNEAIEKIDKAIENLSGYRKGLEENEIINYNLSLEISQLLISSWQKINLYQITFDSKQAVDLYRTSLGSYHLARNYLQLAGNRRQDIHKFKPVSIKNAENLLDDISLEMNGKEYQSAEPNSAFVQYLSRESYLYANPHRERSIRP
jgi:tetratricopeptide (TPR) repeat protein